MSVRDLRVCPREGRLQTLLCRVADPSFHWERGGRAGKGEREGVERRGEIERKGRGGMGKGREGGRRKGEGKEEGKEGKGVMEGCPPFSEILNTPLVQDMCIHYAERHLTLTRTVLWAY